MRQAETQVIAITADGDVEGQVMRHDAYRVDLVQSRAIEVKRIARPRHIGDHHVEQGMLFGSTRDHACSHRGDGGNAMGKLLQAGHGGQPRFGLRGGFGNALQPLERIFEMGCQIGQQQGHLVAARIGFAMKRHGHHGHQRLFGKLPLSFKVTSQSTCTHRKRYVIDCGPGSIPMR